MSLCSLPPVLLSQNSVLRASQARAGMHSGLARGLLALERTVLGSALWWGAGCCSSFHGARFQRQDRAALGPYGRCHS